VLPIVRSLLTHGSRYTLNVYGEAGARVEADEPVPVPASVAAIGPSPAAAAAAAAAAAVPSSDAVAAPTDVPLPTGWTLHHSDAGVPYFYHAASNTSTWTRPGPDGSIPTDDDEAAAADDAQVANQVYYEKEGYDPFEDDAYFDSYTDLGLQAEMIGDEKRSRAYLEAMMRFSEIDFKDKVVLDCGTGTGLLSYFAVKAGARVVYAVEGSGIAPQTLQGVRDNALSDKIIVFHGRMEEVVLPQKVDIIVSEWMGAALIFESMLGSVLFARDRWLKAGGMLYPSRSRIFVAPIEAKDYFNKRVDFWRDVYGMDLRAFQPAAIAGSVEKPMFDRIVKSDDVLADPTTVCELDLMTMSMDECERSLTNFSFTATRDGTLHGLALWFDVTFECAAHRNEPPTTTLEPVILSTTPHETPTHWKQLSLLLDGGIEVSKGDRIHGNLEVLRNTYWRRHFNYDIALGVNDEPADAHTKSFGLWRYKTDNAPLPDVIPKNAL
jgi:hypothetical protein